MDNGILWPLSGVKVVASYLGIEEHNPVLLLIVKNMKCKTGKWSIISLTNY